jgi:hypothetical protein
MRTRESGELGDGKQSSRYHNDHRMRVVSIYRTFDQNIDSGRSAVAELPVHEAEEEAIERWIALNAVSF